MLKKWDETYYNLAKNILDFESEGRLTPDNMSDYLRHVSGLAKQYMELYERIQLQEDSGNTIQSEDFRDWVMVNLTDGHNAKPGDAVVYVDDLLKMINGEG